MGSSRGLWRGARRALTVVLSLLVVGLVVPWSPAGAPAATAQESPRVRLDVTKITPSTVRPSSPSTVTVRGTLTNTTGGPIRNLEMRVQRGAPRATEASVTEALRDSARTPAQTRFTRVVDHLRPGQRAPFTLRVPLTGGPESLRLLREGVYPLLLNVNADLASGTRARVAESHFLLPVLGLPGKSTNAPAKPTPITTLVPLVDYPRMAQEGFPGRPTILTDDRLASSLAPGGRLFGLVQAVSKQVPEGSPLGNSLCFAIDPDLVSTAASMAGGYRVRKEDGGTRPGSGAKAAAAWLKKLGKVTEGRCVISLPYADADLVALGRAELPDLIKGALDGANILRKHLNVEPRRDVLWPIGGALDEPAASQLSETNVGTVLMRPDSLATPEGARRPVRVETRNEDYSPVARPLDPLLADALDSARPEGSDAPQLSPAADATPSVQDTLGALTFRATRAATPGTTSILAPPRRWNLDQRDLSTLLSGLKTLTKAGYVSPTSLPPSKPSSESSDESSSGGEAAPSEQGSSGGEAPQDGTAPEDGGGSDELPHVGLTYPMAASRSEIRQNVLDEIAAQNYKVGELYRTAEEDPALSVLPSDLTTPLRNGLLRATSSAWRGNPADSRHWLRTASKALDRALDGVQINEFAGQVTLTSSTSPIPVTVTNRLPVTVAVNLHVDAPPGIKVDDLGLLKIPPGSRQFWLETQVDRAGRFSVDITVRSEGGTQLGATRRLQLASNAYGTMPLIITLGGGALLILLSARRIFRRARAARAESSTGGTATEGSEGS